MKELLTRSATELGALLRRREVSSEELTRLYCDRIAEHDAALSSFVSVTARAALRAARAIDRRRDASLPFAGVPIAVKDLHLARGTFSRFGSRAFRYLWSPVDDTTVRAIRAAGFVILGKLATSEMGVLPVTEPDIHPPTRNPWRTGLTSGGSSGGSGAAVAARLVPIAEGSDGGGSIRIPAAFCHLYGFKASRGALPNPFARVDPIGLASVGPLTHTVEDAAGFLDALKGRPLRKLVDNTARLRVRFTTRGMLGPTEPAIAACVMTAARALEALGHHVEEGAPVTGSVDEFLPLWERQAANAPVLLESSLQPVTRWLRARGKRHRKADMIPIHRKLERDVLDWFGDVDLWLTPTVGCFPPAVGAWRALDPEATFRAAAPLGQFTALFNLTGQPAASLPLGVSEDGLPVGVQLAARRGQDDLLLALSRQLEQALPWRNRRPP